MLTTNKIHTYLDSLNDEGDLPNCVVHDAVQADWPICTAAGIRNEG